MHLARRELSGRAAQEGNSFPAAWSFTSCEPYSRREPAVQSFSDAAPATEVRGALPASSGAAQPAPAPAVEVHSFAVPPSQSVATAPEAEPAAAVAPAPQPAPELVPASAAEALTELPAAEAAAVVPPAPQTAPEPVPAPLAEALTELQAAEAQLQRCLRLPSWPLSRSQRHWLRRPPNFQRQSQLQLCLRLPSRPPSRSQRQRQRRPHPSQRQRLSASLVKPQKPPRLQHRPHSQSQHRRPSRPWLFQQRRLLQRPLSPATLLLRSQSQRCHPQLWRARCHTWKPVLLLLLLPQTLMGSGRAGVPSWPTGSPSRPSLRNL